MEILISNIVLSMREFQKNKGIKKQCVTNAQYLYDIIKMNSIDNVKAKAVFVFSCDDDTNTLVFVGGHLVVMLEDGTMIDPSYDIFCLKDKSYFDNIKDLMDMFNENSKMILKSGVDIKQIVRDHIHFIKLAEQINNGKHTFTTKKFYDDQADYIEKKYSR